MANVAASVKQRLLNIASVSGEEFEQLLVRYASERMLYRLSVSSHRNAFVLKGAMLFVAWEGVPHRATRDIDLLGFGDDSIDRMTQVIRELCEISVEDDGLVFDSKELRSEVIRTAEEYGGVRSVLVAKLGSALIRIQIDVGFGDVITPHAEEIEFPTLLDFPKPHVRAYPVETVIAEKLLAIIERGLTNSRMKDYFDLHYLRQTRNFDGLLLAKALRATAQRRGVTLSQDSPVGLGSEYGEDPMKQKQWAALMNRIGSEDSIRGFPEVVRQIAEFALPISEYASTGREFFRRWNAGGPWIETGTG